MKANGVVSGRLVVGLGLSFCFKGAHFYGIIYVGVFFFFLEFWIGVIISLKIIILGQIMNMNDMNKGYIASMEWHGMACTRPKTPHS